MTKHFPGGGPQKDGEDPHFAYGREQVYPGGEFELHLKPFEAAFAAGTGQIMPYYGMPIGTEYEEVGFGFNKSRASPGCCASASASTASSAPTGACSPTPRSWASRFPARAWGVEHLTTRRAHGQDAGCRRRPVRRRGDARSCSSSSSSTATSSEERLDVSARRLLREKFRARPLRPPLRRRRGRRAIVGAAEFRAAGEAAQRASITLLTNEIERMPGRRRADPPARPRRCSLYVEGLAPEVAAEYGEVVERPGGGRRRDPPPAGAVRAARRRLRELLPRRLARLPDEVVAHVARGRRAGAHGRRRVPRSAGDPRRRSSVGVAAVVANYGANPRGAAGRADRRRAPRRAGCRSTCPSQHGRRRGRPAPTCRSTRPTRCSGSGTACATRADRDPTRPTGPTSATDAAASRRGIRRRASISP